jgi:hypothetical protein
MYCFTVLIECIEVSSAIVRGTVDPHLALEFVEDFTLAYILFNKYQENIVSR